MNFRFDAKLSPPVLAKGQTWRTRAADIEILGVANCFVHYTVKSRLGTRRTTAQVSGIGPMANYLRLTAARLLPTGRTAAHDGSCPRRASMRGFTKGRLWTKRILPIYLRSSGTRTKRPSVSQA